jgi:hypothetical protein
MKIQVQIRVQSDERQAEVVQEAAHLERSPSRPTRQAVLPDCTIWVAKRATKARKRSYVPFSWGIQDIAVGPIYLLLIHAPTRMPGPRVPGTRQTTARPQELLSNTERLA